MSGLGQVVTASGHPFIGHQMRREVVLGAVVTGIEAIMHSRALGVYQTDGQPTS